jgi:hypothetical protein
VPAPRLAISVIWPESGGAVDTDVSAREHDVSCTEDVLYVLSPCITALRPVARAISDSASRTTCSGL